jgi:hypothetical protein
MTKTEAHVQLGYTSVAIYRCNLGVVPWLFRLLIQGAALF